LVALRVLLDAALHPVAEHGSNLGILLPSVLTPIKHRRRAEVEKRLDRKRAA